nr:alpha-1,4-glucan--maltose-1-phosphate maltosyltransferase [uncultured Desulfobacter sp.]
MTDIIKRVVIENVTPNVDGGRFPARRVVNDTVVVTADIFVDGHDRLSARLLHRKAGATHWEKTPMQPQVNDLWQAVFIPCELGIYEYTVTAWIDRFETWRSQIEKKIADDQVVAVELMEGAAMVTEAAGRAKNEDAEQLNLLAGRLLSEEAVKQPAAFVQDTTLSLLMARYPDTGTQIDYPRILPLRIEPRKALYSTWYEMFPRSCADTDPLSHGTFQDCIKRLPYIAGMGFDVLYLPPIHPIGPSHRKGKNNAILAGPGDPGSPWAIGSKEGGHKDIHPELGTLADFRALLAKAREYGIDIALDMAFQCSPDHPYVTDHPEWFHSRPDGTIQYAENPPKKYQDIYPFAFDCAHYDSLRRELLDVVRYWIDQGVRIFRVDNPHTKPLRFWEWLIAACKEQNPETIFLAEAFTRPKTMYRLAKGGFTQSYTYFTWRNLKWEIQQYLDTLTRTGVKDFFWPNLWPNTPDILPEFLQLGGRPAFILRLMLAATLSSSYGIYGPAFELCVNMPLPPDGEAYGEEYMDSEKFEISRWDLNASHTIRPFITRINRIRRENPALQQTRNLIFHPVDKEEILCFSKYTDDFSNIIFVAANLDPHHTHSAWVRLPFEEMGIPIEKSFQMHDLVSDARYLWHDDFNFLEISPQVVPVQVFRIRRRMRTENDFDYFM